MPRRVRYQVAMSLDGYLAGPNDEHDWIVPDPEVDFAALFEQFDTFLVGRRTYERMAAGGMGTLPGRTFVFSRSRRPPATDGVTFVADQAETLVRRLKEETGKDIWLFGGGQLFHSLLGLGLVDTVETAVVPILLGGGLPLLPPPAPRTALRHTGSRTYRRSGIVLLEYDVVR